LAQEIPAGTKNFVVTGKVNMFGKPRTRVTRLLESVFPGQNILFVEANLDYQKGDKLGLPATNIDPYNSETVIVESYEPSGGVI
jgi:hypothetical protein